MNKIICGSIFSAAFFLMISCASTSQSSATEREPPAPAVQEYEADPSEAVSIAMPEVNRSYFGSIAPRILENVEIGSPDSLKSALSQLKKEASQYTEAEKVLVTVAAAILQLVWRSETVAVTVPEVDTANAYLGAIASARDGIYDSSTGNTDFLTKVLPSLVLVTSDTRNDYYEQAQRDLQSALQERENSVLAQYLLGILYRRMGQHTEALAAFSKTTELAPQCYEASYALAQEAMYAGNTTTALEQTQALLQTNGTNRDLLKLSAEAAFAAGDLDAAEQYVARVLQQESDNAAYVLFRAKILVQKGDYIKAASLLDVYARTDTTSRDYLVLRSKVQKDWNRNTTAATATIEQALQRYPDDTEIILTAAALASQTGTPIGGKSAAELAEQILAQDANNVAALQIQIAELQRTRRYADAYKVSAALMALPSVPPDAVYTHIAICLASNHTDEAWREAARLYNETPTDEAVLQSYMQVLVSTGRTQEASRLIAQQLPTANARMKSFLYYERSFISQGEEAILSDLRASLTSNPRNKDALMRLYQIYYRKKEYRKAQYYLKQVVALSPNDEQVLELDRELGRLLSR